MDRRIESLTFGVELECHLPAGLSRYDAAERVSAAIGKPVNCEGYNHHDGNYWKVVSDQSLNGTANSWEFVSPILKGEEGMAELKTVMDTMIAMGITVSSACGTHVHVGCGRNPNVNPLKRMIKTYAQFEPAIDTVIQPSRRGNNHRMTRSMVTVSSTRIDAVQEWRQLTSLSIFPHDRFYKLNVGHAILRHGTIEFRQHGGTLEFPKLRIWILFCLRFFAAAMDASMTVPSTEETQPVNQARYGSKSYQIGQLLLRPEGCTAEEAMALVGWPSVSMVQQARICGLTLYKDRMGRRVRFYARATSSSTAIQAGPITLERLLTMIGASEEEKTYFANRAAMFAAREARNRTAYDVAMETRPTD